MTATGQNFSLFCGDTRQIIINAVDENGNILDLTSYSSITWVIYKQTTKETVLTKALGSGITVPIPSNGQIVIDLLPADTENITPSIYNHECEVSDGVNAVYTITTGIVSLFYSKA